MKVEPQQEHAWLQRLIGDWVYEGDCDMGDGKPRAKSSGTDTVRALGGLWIVCEGHGEMPGGVPAATILTLGYNPLTKRYPGTWVGSMMSHLWVYDGEMDAGGKVLTLNCEGPSFDGDGTTSKYRDVIEVITDDHRTLSALVQRKDGTWHHFMTTHYRRK